MTLLRAEGLTVRYGGVHALDGVSFDVADGSLIGLIGPNGAGKTTCIDALSGFAEHAGNVVFGGRDLAGVPPHARARLGLVRTFQGSELFDDLDVLGNLLVAAARPRWWHPLADLVRPARATSTTAAAVDQAVRVLDLAHLLDRPVAVLSEGERKLVALGRALARGPRLLLLDEPAAGLDTDESRALGERLRRIVDGGVAVVLVDHDVDLVLSVCDTVHVLDHGTLLASGPPSVVRDDPEVVRAYLGNPV